MSALITKARRDFHRELVVYETLSISDIGVASNADSSQKTSKFIGLFIAQALHAREATKKLDGQRAGNQFESAVKNFVAATFPKLETLRPGDWDVEHVGGSRKTYQIAKFEPYTHLDNLARAIEDNPTLASVLGNSYEVSPDVIVTRRPEADSTINRVEPVVDSSSAFHSILRESNQQNAIVHAVISCKWTLRSDRAQNARSEALNIIRNRKGRTPHIVVVTGEPTPSRLASLALGTGDIDTVYHFALNELQKAVTLTGNDEAVNMLGILVDGKRLRDISDLPLDLAV